MGGFTLPLVVDLQPLLKRIPKVVRRNGIVPASARRFALECVQPCLVANLPNVRRTLPLSGLRERVDINNPADRKLA